MDSQFVLLVIALYFLPAIIASARHHPNRHAIFVLNLLLGLTCIGWIGAMVWACTFIVPQDRGPFAIPVKGDPRWANLRSTPTTQVLTQTSMPASGSMAVWTGLLLVAGVSIVTIIKGVS